MNTDLVLRRGNNVYEKGVTSLLDLVNGAIVTKNLSEEVYLRLHEKLDEYVSLQTHIVKKQDVADVVNNAMIDVIEKIYEAKQKPLKNVSAFVMNGAKRALENYVESIHVEGTRLHEGTVLLTYENIIITQIDSLKIHNFLGRLTDLERQVLIMRFGLNNNGEFMMLAEVGKLLGITRERVRKVESQTLQKLRQDKTIRKYFKGILE